MERKKYDLLVMALLEWSKRVMGVLDTQQSKCEGNKKL